MKWLHELRKSPHQDHGAGATSLEEIRTALAHKGVSAVGPADLADVTGDADVEYLRHLQKEFSGLGMFVEPLLDPTVTDVVLNPDGGMWVDRGAGMQPNPCEKLSMEERRELAVRLATRCGSRLDSSMPFADGVLAHLPEDIPATAIRVHCALNPPANDGPSISLRVLSAGLGNLQVLQATGMLPGDVPAILRRLVAERRNVLISGGTGAGKTSLLTAMLAEVPHDQRLLVLEDTPEIIAQHPHVVGLTTRRANAEGQGDIPMSSLVKQSLRMRPDRIVVGEIRGAEIADLLVALNTGHEGSAGTIHANSPHAVPGRLEALGAMAGMSERSLVRQALDGIDALVHVARTPQGRTVTHIGHLVDHAGSLAVEMLWELA